MRGISSPALFELRAQKMAECRGLAPLARRHALFSKQARFACPAGIPENGRRGETFKCRRPNAEGRTNDRLVRNFVNILHSSFCTPHSRWSAPRDLHPEGSAILSRWGLLFPLRPGAVKLACQVEVRREARFRLKKRLRRGNLHSLLHSERRLVGMKGLAPPRLPGSESGPSAIRVKPHAPKPISEFMNQ